MAADSNRTRASGDAGASLPRMPGRCRPLMRALPALVIVTFLGVAVYRLGAPSLWFDEAASWLNTSGSWQFLAQRVVQGEDCGGFLYAVILKIWTSGFGASEQALRFPSVVAGCGFIALATLLGRRIGGAAAGCYAGILAACHPTTLFFARQSRAYAFVLLATAGCMYGAMALRHSRRAAGILLMGSSLLVTSLHIFGVLVPVGLLAWSLIASRGRCASREVRLVLPVSLSCMAIAAGWAMVMHERIASILDDFWVRTTLVQAWSGVLREFLPLLYVSIPALVAGSILLARRKEHRSTFVLLTAIAATVAGGAILASLLTHGSHHFILPRYMLPLLPVLLLPIAILLSRLPVALGASCAVLLLGAWCYERPPQRLYRASDPWGLDSRAAAMHLLKNRRLDERVLVFPEYEGVTLAYYGVGSHKAAGRRRQLDTLDRLQTDGVGYWLVFYGNQGQELQRQLLFNGHPLSARFGAIRVFEPFTQRTGPHSAAQ